MFNNLPGQGLGETASRLLAFGLGQTITIEVVSGPSAASRLKYRISYEDYELETLMADDQDFLELLIIMAEAGIFD